MFWRTWYKLGNLLMLLCIPIFQRTRYPYQEGSWGTQFKNLGLRPKVVRVRHNPPAHKQAPNTALYQLQAAGTSHSNSPLKAFSLCLFLRLVSQTLLHKWVSFPRHAWAGLVRAADTLAPAVRGSPYRLPLPWKLHLNRELGEGHRGKIWQACIGLQGFSIKEIQNTNTQQHPCIQTSLSFWYRSVPQEWRGCCSHAKGQENTCDKLWGLTSTQHRDYFFQSPRLISKQTTSDRWLISVVMGDSPRAQVRRMPRCVGELKGSFHVEGLTSKEVI